MAPQMWLSVCVLALLLSGAEVVNITKRSMDTAATVQTGARFLGLSYNLLKADPYVEFAWRFPRRVVDLDLGLVASYPRYTCAPQPFTYIYDEKSFQKNFDLSVSTEIGVSAKLVENRFALSSGLSDLMKNEVTIMMETQILCNLGRYRLKTDLNSHKASQGFRAAVCELPDNYEQAAYVRFIDDWGTNFVVEVDVGIRNLSQKTETFPSVYQTLQRHIGRSISANATYGGAFASINGSVEMNMHLLDKSHQLKEAFTGVEMIKRIGTDDRPEPIWVNLGSIDSLVSATYFTAPNPSACTEAVLFKLVTKKVNLARALDEYPAAKQAMVFASDGKVSFPLSWPKGTYGLLKPKDSCPADWAYNGERFWDCENDAGSIVWATPDNHIDGHIKENILLKFCMKTNQQPSEEEDLDWPVGEYCLFRYGSCPSGFRQGNIYWDDEDTNNINFVTGNAPDGVYNKDTLMHFCCRTDGYNSIPVFLPTDTPFYLLQASSYGCQKVHGMNVATEEVQWDDEDGSSDNPNTNKALGTVPFNKPTSSDGGRDWRLYFCYYTKA